MAIERASEEMMSDETPEVAPEESPEEVTASLPASILAGQSVSPGDVVRLEVVSADDKDGTITVKYAAEPAKEEPPAKRGMESMAAEFD